MSLLYILGKKNKYYLITWQVIENIQETNQMENIDIISPWIEKAELSSPNGEFRVEYPDGSEIAMGAPTSGSLYLYWNQKKKVISYRAGASFIWSSDSKYLAYSEWTKHNSQIVKVMRMHDMNDKIGSSELRVIQFVSFESSIIKAIDSPIYMPVKIEIDILKIFMEI